MTLRDLTPRQLYNLRRKCRKEERTFLRQLDRIGHCYNNANAWNAAFNAGVKEALKLCHSLENT